MSESLTIDRKLIFNRKGQIVQRLRNNSGGTVNAGAVVVYDTTTTDAFTTTATQNDEDVAGVCLATVANQGTAEVLWMGFTDLLKVDGTTDIAVGDYLTSFTTAGVAAKRGANTSQGQFALALEAYTTNDGNGVIDAWIFPANRVAGATSSWGDDALLNLGTNSDIALVHRALALAADTTLAGVVEGTPDTIATAADSLIIGNVTNDGDIHLVVSKAGNTHTAFLADGSTGDTILNASSGQSVDFYVAGTKEYDLSATILDLNGNHLDNSGYLILNAVTNPAGTEVYASHDNAGDLTLNALTGKTVNLAVAGTDVVNVAGASVTLAQQLVISSGGANITGDVTVTGSLTFGGNWTVAATLTVDELILDTDGSQPAGTNAYWVRDNAGDLTGNAITGKQVIVAINNTDEYTFSATIADFSDNAIDNAGYLILNAATAPAGTEVYAVNDNTGDLTLNALSTKAVHVAIAGVDEVDFSGTAHVINEASNDRDFRVESADMAYMLYVDGAKNTVTLGANTDTSDVDEILGIRRAARTATANQTYADLYISPTGAVTIPAGTAAFAAALAIAEPNFTATGTITAAASFLVEGTPTEGGLNAAIAIAADDAALAVGASFDAQLDWSTADADNHTLVLKLGASMAVHVCDNGDEGTDWNVAADSHPSLYVHSTTTPATDYAKLSHDATNAYLDAVGGNWAFQIAGTSELTLAANLLNLVDSTLAGSSAAHSADTADGSMYLQSTSNATKGFICVANADLGLVIGSDGSVDRATTVGTNAIHVFNGTAPAGTLTNGISLYSTGGECYIMDAAGNATLQSPHTEDGDYIIHSYSIKKNKTMRVHLEKLLRRMAVDPQYRDLIEERQGMVHGSDW